MQPFLMGSNRVVVFRWAYLFSQPRKGDVIVFRGSNGLAYVKRITALASKNKLVVEGDNKGDSRELGPVERKSVIGKVLFVY